MPVVQWRTNKGHISIGAGIAPVLAALGGTHSFQLSVKNDPLGLPIAVVNDLLRMKAVTAAGAVLDNWLKVTGRDTSNTAYTVYTVVKQSGTAGVFPAGTAVVNYGQSGQGFLFLTSDDADGPFYSVRTHAGAPWTTQTEVARFGNLKNSFGVGANNRYGFAAGDYAGGNYLLYNPTDGFVLTAGAGAVVIDLNGVTITGNAVNVYSRTHGVNFSQSGTVFASLWGARDATDSSIVLENDGDSSHNAQVALRVTAVTGKIANIDLNANGPAGGSAGVTITSNTTSTVAIAATHTTVSGGLDVGTASGAVTGAINTSGSLTVGLTTDTGAAAITDNLRDAGTSTTPDALILGHFSSGTPVAGFGVELLFNSETSTNTVRNLATLTASWATATDASRSGRVIFKVGAAGTGLVEVMRLEQASGGPVKIGFLGATAQSAAASGGAAPAGGVGTAAGGWDTAVHRDSAITLLNNIRTALVNLGLMT